MKKDYFYCSSLFLLYFCVFFIRNETKRKRKYKIEGIFLVNESDVFLPESTSLLAEQVQLIHQESNAKFAFKRAFVTLVANDQSTLGALILNEALRDLNSKHPLIVMVTEEVSQKNIKRFMCQGMHIFSVKYVKIPSHVNVEHKWWLPSFTKLQIWSLYKHGIEKLVWIDGDSIIMHEIDELFEMRELSAAQDFVGLELQVNKICGGLMVVDPSESTYGDLMELLYEDKNKTWFNGDQELINYYFNVTKKYITVLEPRWSTFVGRLCPQASIQKIGHFTHWGISLSKPLLRTDLEKRVRLECTRPYYERWVSMWEKSEQRFQNYNECRTAQDEGFVWMLVG